VLSQSSMRVCIFPRLRRSNVIPLVLGALPALPWVWLVLRADVEIPVFDELRMIPLFADWAAAGSVPARLFERSGTGGVHQSEALKLLLSALAFASGWHIRWEVVANLLLAIASYLGVFFLSQRSACPPARRIVVSALTGALVFSPSQNWNLLWGYALAYFLIHAVLVWSLVLLTSERATRHWVGAVALAGGGCFVSSFLLAHGLLLWIALLPALVGLAKRNGRALLIGSLWVILFLVTASLFWQNAPASHIAGCIGRIAPHSRKLLLYALALLGSPIAYATVIGPPRSSGYVPFSAAGVLTLAAFFLVVAQHLRITGPKSRALEAWTGLGIFSLGYAALNALGRASLEGLAAVNGLMSMYSTPVVLLGVAVVQLAGSMPATPASSSGIAGRTPFLRLAGVLGAVVLAAAFAFNAWHVYGGMARGLARLTDRKHCFAAFHFFREGSTCYPIHTLAKTVGVEPMIDTLASLGFRRIRRDLRPVEAAPALRLSRASARPVGGPLRHFLPPYEVFAVTDADWLVEGELVPAEAADGVEVPVAIFLAADDDRKFVGHAPVDGSGRWRTFIPQVFVPPRTKELRAWAYLERRGELARLPGGILLSSDTR
jgi:hypothetical protein